MSKLSQIIEALLFASDEPLTLRRLKNILTEPAEPVSAGDAPAANDAAAMEPVAAAEAEPQDQAQEGEEPAAAKPTKLDDEIRQAIAELKEKYSSEHSPVVLMELAEGWQMATNPAYGQWVKKLFKNRMSFRLSQAALETLSIVAYRQPITRAEVEHIRGVEVIASLETLIERGLLKVVGRKETVGRPMLYGTSPEFLRQFGLRSLDDLPPLTEELPAGIELAQAEAESPAPETAEPVPAEAVETAQATES